jgi:hypothetical protein
MHFQSDTLAEQWAAEAELEKSELPKLEPVETPITTLAVFG